MLWRSTREGGEKGRSEQEAEARVFHEPPKGKRGKPSSSIFARREKGRDDQMFLGEGKERRNCT